MCGRRYRESTTPQYRWPPDFLCFGGVGWDGAFYLFVHDLIIVVLVLVVFLS